MKATLWSFLFLLGGCDSLWAQFDHNQPANCVQDPSICAPGQLCDPMSEVCVSPPPPPDMNMTPLPTSCADIKNLLGSPEDGPYTVYVGGDPGKPWVDNCLGMTTLGATPMDYLALKNVGNANYSQYTAGGASPGSNVRTYYSRIRIDPQTLEVDIKDQTYTGSSGRLNHSGSGTMVTSMPYGVAMDCAAIFSATGVGNVDLTGTPFAVAPNAWILRVTMQPPAGAVTYSMNNQVVDLTGGGSCGYTVPAPDFGSPINISGGFQLRLVYVGM